MEQEICFDASAANHQHQQFCAFFQCECIRHARYKRLTEIASVQIDLRSNYERKQDGLGLLVKNAHVMKVDRRKGAATLQVPAQPFMHITPD